MWTGCRANIKTPIKNTESLIVDWWFSDRHKQATFSRPLMYSLMYKILKFLLFQDALPSIIDYYLLQFSDLALSPLCTEILLLSCRLKYLSIYLIINLLLVWWDACTIFFFLATKLVWKSAFRQKCCEKFYSSSNFLSQVLKGTFSGIFTSLAFFKRVVYYLSRFARNS